MGITGLLPFLANSSKKCHISEFKGCTVAIDSYCWLHKGAFSCAEKLVRGEETHLHINYCLKFIKMLQSYNIKPILVFDGQHLLAKRETKSKRREQIRFARKQGIELLRLGKVEEAHSYFRKCVDITHKIAFMLIQECRKLNVDCIVAPFEADAQLAYFSITEIADIVITEDPDLILFGCYKILFKLSLNGFGMLVDKYKLNNSMNMRPNEFSFDKFRYMCILSGCDYLESLPGIGLKRALKAVKMTCDPDIYKLIPRLPTYLNIKTLKVTAAYIENFKVADATFKHQIIYDPIQRKLLPLTDPASCGTPKEYLKNAGTYCDPNKALQLALGNIDPITFEVLDKWNPDDFLNTPVASSIWSGNYKKQHYAEPSTEILSFDTTVTRKRVNISTKKINIEDEQSVDDYDKKLSDELEMYPVEPSPKRPRLEHSQNDTPTLESHTEDTSSLLNPKRYSKVERTSLDSNGSSVTSRFLASKSTPTPTGCSVTPSKNINTQQEPSVSQEQEQKLNKFKFSMSSSIKHLTKEQEQKLNKFKFSMSSSIKHLTQEQEQKLKKFKFSMASSIKHLTAQDNNLSSSPPENLSDLESTVSNLDVLSVYSVTPSKNINTQQEPSVSQEQEQKLKKFKFSMASSIKHLTKQDNNLLSSPSENLSGSDSTVSNLDVLSANSKQPKKKLPGRSSNDTSPNSQNLDYNETVNSNNVYIEENEISVVTISSTTVYNESDDVHHVQSSEDENQVSPIITHFNRTFRYNKSYKKCKKLKENLEDITIISCHGSCNEETENDEQSDYYEGSDENISNVGFKNTPELEIEISDTEDSIVDNDSNKETLTPEQEQTDKSALQEDANSEVTSQSDSNSESVITDDDIPKTISGKKVIVNLDVNRKDFMVTSNEYVSNTGSSRSTQAEGRRVNISENPGPSASNVDNSQKRAVQSGRSTKPTKSSQIKKGSVQLTISGMFEKLRSKDNS